AVAGAEDRHHDHHREVPEADDGVDRTVEGLQLLDGAVEQHRYGDVLSLQLLHRQQAVEGELTGAGQTPADLLIVLVEPEDGVVPGHHCSLAALWPAGRRPRVPDNGYAGPACPTTGPPAPRARHRVRQS